jgi:hypothetical protein
MQGRRGVPDWRGEVADVELALEVVIQPLERGRRVVGQLAVALVDQEPWLLIATISEIVVFTPVSS